MSMAELCCRSEEWMCCCKAEVSALAMVHTKTMLQASVLWKTMRRMTMSLIVLHCTEACKVMFFSLSRDGSKCTDQRLQELICTNN